MQWHNIVIIQMKPPQIVIWTAIKIVRAKAGWIKIFLFICFGFFNDFNNAGGAP